MTAKKLTKEKEEFFKTLNKVIRTTKKWDTYFTEHIHEFSPAEREEMAAVARKARDAWLVVLNELRREPHK
jgi:hypothetical protein